MIEATLRNKIPKEVRNHEDCLTSTVWGLLKYTPLRHILARFLSQATLYADNTVKLESQIPERQIEATTRHFEFWPSDRELGEPDLLVVGDDFVLAVEDKYNAGLSGNHQLRKYKLLLDKMYPRLTRRHVVFLTAGWIPPILDAEATLGLEESIWWLSWYALHEVIVDPANETPFAKEIAKDLARYLDHLGFHWYHGLSTPHINQLDNYFWQDVTPLISTYEPQPNQSRHFWLEEKL